MNKQGTHVATYGGVEFSRYTIEWTNGPLHAGARLYAAPDAATSEKARLWDFFNARLLSRSGIVLSSEQECQNAVNDWADAHEVRCNHRTKMQGTERIERSGGAVHTVIVPHPTPCAKWGVTADMEDRVRALAEKWNKAAIADGFAGSGPAYELFDVLDTPHASEGEATSERKPLTAAERERIAQIDRELANMPKTWRVDELKKERAAIEQHHGIGGGK